MKDQSEFSFKPKHKVCINLLSSLHQPFLRLSQKQSNLFLESLYEKHKQKILRHKIAPIKKTATTQYQPKYSEYKKIVIYSISPNLWKRYKHLKEITGYSISYIIRAFIEWELMEKQEEVTNPLIPLQQEEIGRREIEMPSQLTHNYVIRVRWRRQNNTIKILFWDDR